MKLYSFKTYKQTEQYKPKEKEELKTLYCFECPDGTVFKNTLSDVKDLPEFKPNSRYVFVYEHWETRKNGWRQFDKLVEVKLLTKDVLESLIGGETRKA